MKKIIFVLPSLSVGGAENVVANIIKYLNKDDYKIILALGNKVGKYLSIIPKEVEIVELSDSRRAMLSFLPLLKLIKKEKPDIVFSSLGMVSISALCSFFVSGKVRFISRFGNTLSADLERVRRDSYLKSKLQYLYYSVVINRCELVAQSEFMKNDIVDTFNAKNKKINVIYNPCFIDESILESKGEGNQLSLYAVGRFDWQKGYDLLIESFQQVYQVNKDIKLFFIGDGKLRKELESKVLNEKMSGNIHFLGYKEAPFSLLDNRSILVSSSRFEGFSNVIVEALALGVPVVATDCPSGNREIMKHGKNGLLVKFDSNVVNNLSDSIIEIVNTFDNYDMKSESKLIKDKFSIQKTLKKYDDLFRGEMNV